jgi:hypothetical protein
MKAISIWVEGGGLLLVPLLSRGERLRLDSSHPFGPLAAGAEEDVRGLCKGLEVELHNELGLRSPEKVPVEEWDRGSLSELPLEAYWSLSINVQRVSKVPGEEPKLRSATVLSLQRRGAGTLGLLAFDPSGENLHQWKHKGRFLDVVLSPAPSGVLARQRPIWPEAAARDIVQPQAGKQPAVGWFVLFILIFILLIGPADYWLVNRLHKPRLTWLTFPVTVLLFSGIAWNMGQGRIGALEYREVTFVDFLRPRAREALAVSFIGVYADTNQSLTFKPLAPRAEVDLLARESGGERAYVEGGKEEDLVQKMHIWAYHGYKTIWREEERILAGVWSGEDGPARILLEQDLPVAPLLSLASWSGKLYRLSAPAGNPAKEPYEARVEKEIPWAELRGALESIWDGRIPAPFIQRLKEETALSPSLIVILPRPWPALEIVERRPSSTLGFCVVRSPLVIQGSEGDK